MKHKTRENSFNQGVRLKLSQSVRLIKAASQVAMSRKDIEANIERTFITTAFELRFSAFSREKLLKAPRLGIIFRARLLAEKIINKFL